MRLDLLAALSGILISLQARTNGELSLRLNNGLQAAFISFTSGFLLIALITIFHPGIRSGAKKLVDEVNITKIDGQIDAYMSRMVQQDKLNVYVYQHQLIVPIGNTSDIQIELRANTNDPFNFHGYTV